MCFKYFTLTQDGKHAGGFTALKQAVSAAAHLAAKTRWPVTITAHIAGRGTREAVINPDGTNEGIWRIDKGRPLVPTAGQVYANRSGGSYRCLSAVTASCPTYYNAAGGCSSTAAVFRNVKSGWTFTAKGIIQYADGTIEWDHSTNGRFEEKEDE